jgi:hypothetical protein
MTASVVRLVIRHRPDRLLDGGLLRAREVHGRVRIGCRDDPAVRSRVLVL